MSKAFSAARYLITGAAFGVCTLFTPSSGAGQYGQQAMYVCQTQTFWCSFIFAAGAPNGSPCYCNTAWGPVTGYSINPNGVPNAPKLPNPQRPSPNPPNPGGPEGTVGADDCYKGLGNCPGSFIRSGRGGTANGTSSSGGTTPRSSSAFATGLQTLIEASAGDFDSVQGEARRGSSASDYYETTVVPAGLRRCTLFVPKRSGRESRVSCWAPDNMSFTRLVELVTDALGDRGSVDEDGRLWKVGEVDILADRTDRTITVQRR